MESELLENPALFIVGKCLNDAFWTGRRDGRGAGFGPASKTRPAGPPDLV